MSYKVIVSTTGDATVSDATFADLATTLFSTDSALTGSYGLIQKVGLVAIGAAVQNYRLGNGWNFLQAR
jgi:hypothetical protein